MDVWLTNIYYEETQMNYKSPLCSCIACHEVKSEKGIFSHYINAHTDEGKKKTIERGRKGGENSREHSVNLRQSNIDAYLEKPSKCKQCDKILPYDIKGNMFCGHSCAAIHNNSLRGHKEPKKSNVELRKFLFKKLTYNCLQCGTIKECNNANANKYCSITCQNNYQHEQRVRKWLTEGAKTDIRVIKRYLKETREYVCSGCGISNMYNNKPIVLEIEHIDGNSDNNNLNNLCWLCPNCHSQTPTYKAKNKGNGRHYRRERYKSGKSF